MWIEMDELVDRRFEFTRVRGLDQVLFLVFCPLVRFPKKTFHTIIRIAAIFGHDAPKPADLPGEAYVVVGIYSWRRGRQLGWFFGSDRRARGNGLGARAFPRRFDGGEPIERGRDAPVVGSVGKPGAASRHRPGPGSKHGSGDPQREGNQKKAVSRLGRSPMKSIGSRAVRS